MKKRLAPLLIAILILGQLLGQTVCAAGLPTDEAAVFGDYRDIPGVTQEEIAAIEAVKGRRASLTYGMTYSTEAFLDEEGEIGGFTGLFCAWLTQLFDIEFTPALYEWEDLLEGLEDGRINFTGDLVATDERLPRFYMTDPIAERVLRLLRLKDSESTFEIAKRRKPRYITYQSMRGSAAVNVLKANQSSAFLIYYGNTYDTITQGLRAGLYDGFLIDASGEAAFQMYTDLDVDRDMTSEIFYPLTYSSVSFSSAVEELRPFVSVLQKFLEADSGDFLAEMYQLGELDYMQYKLYMNLTEAERTYLDMYKSGGCVVPVAVEYDNYPISFYNEAEDAYQGIALDVLEEIGKLTGLCFEQANQEPTGFNQLVEMVERGDALLITELIYTNERSKRFMWTDEPFTLDNVALHSRVDTDPITISQITSYRVGLPAGTVFEEYFYEWFPNHTDTVVYPTYDDAFNGLEAGEVDLVIATRNLLLSITNFQEKPGFQTNLVFSQEADSRFGVNLEHPLLASIISKAQSYVDTDEITDRWTRRVYDYRAKIAQMQIPYLVAVLISFGIIIMLMIILVLRNRSMNRELEELVLQRTHELEVQTTAAQVASKAKGEFLARMSHEIRTPLNAVIGMAQIARMSSARGEQIKKQLDEILKASSHLLDILNDVLDMSKIEAGKMTLSSEPFGLFPVLGEVVSIFKQRCEEKRITFYSNYADLTGVHILGDRLHLKQILINLLGNAVKFTEQGGEVDFLITRDREDQDSITITFAVIDNGIGMSEEQSTKLFQAFEQADSSISTRFGGSGLGLAISQFLVRRMGGEIQIVSELGVGSTFLFTLCFWKAGASEKTEEISTPAAELNLSNRHILLVEDIEVNRIILLELLKDTNVNIDQAENGQEAVTLFEKSPVGYYDLIFMDVQMPVLNGYQATAAIRALSREDAATVPIIAMTANAYNEDIAKESEVGMSGHISKPIDIAIVKQVLADIFPDAVFVPESPGIGF